MKSIYLPTHSKISTLIKSKDKALRELKKIDLSDYKLWKKIKLRDNIIQPEYKISRV